MLPSVEVQFQFSVIGEPASIGGGCSRRSKVLIADVAGSEATAIADLGEAAPAVCRFYRLLQQQPRPDNVFTAALYGQLDEVLDFLREKVDIFLVITPHETQQGKREDRYVAFSVRDVIETEALQEQEQLRTQEGLTGGGRLSAAATSRIYSTELDPTDGGPQLSIHLTVRQQATVQPAEFERSRCSYQRVVHDLVAAVAATAASAWRWAASGLVAADHCRATTDEAIAAAAATGGALYLSCSVWTAWTAPPGLNRQSGEHRHLYAARRYVGALEVCAAAFLGGLCRSFSAAASACANGRRRSSQLPETWIAFAAQSAAAATAAAATPSTRDGGVCTDAEGQFELWRITHQLNAERELRRSETAMRQQLEEAFARGELQRVQVRQFALLPVRLLQEVEQRKQQMQQLQQQLREMTEQLQQKALELQQRERRLQQEHQMLAAAAADAELRLVADCHQTKEAAKHALQIESRQQQLLLQQLQEASAVAAAAAARAAAAEAEAAQCRRELCESPLVQIKAQLQLKTYQARDLALKLDAMTASRNYFLRSCSLLLQELRAAKQPRADAATAAAAAAARHDDGGECRPY
ncbi:uncharacterized protein LOC34623100 [Cyclospora cayetanensis]|uniref:Uncharacterized protein LOC34623100 n=1 Tax=Cyclospora cayetanensis TaxID=88456 RepID=A0A6P6S1X0_9EIME|nr:uncharacterized protein LOC34623100 [Cyclospora cayetanensis]